MKFSRTGLRLLGACLKVDEMQPKAELIRSIQWLRAFAALAVVEIHAAAVLSKTGANGSFGADSQAGRAGVDLFFVISGFIIYFVTRGQAGGLKQTLNFWKQRAIRVVPIYWLMTLVTIAIAAFAPSLTEYKIEVRHIIASFLFISFLDLNGNISPPLRAG